MNDSEGLEGGTICPSPCGEWFRGVGGMEYLSFTFFMNDSEGLEGGGICP